MKVIYQDPWPCGVTKVSLLQFKRHRKALGRIKRVVYLENKILDAVTIVIGEDAMLFLDGLAVGYRGEGPRGLTQLLDEVGACYVDLDVYGLHYQLNYRVWRVR